MRVFYFIFILFIVLLSAPARCAGQANFVVSDSTGCSPLVVHFHTALPCDTCTYSWSFGNATPAVGGDSASTTYLGVGTYTVTLTTHSGAATFTHSRVITVFPSPVVSFTVNDTAFCPGTAVTFTSTGSSGAPGPFTCTWNYGDGSDTSSGTPSTHIYSVPGHYNATLVVTNSEGCVSTLNKPAYIHVYDAPASAFSAGTTSVCNPPGIFTFINTTTGTAPLTYSWSFGDGATSTIFNPVHTYPNAGTYSVKLFVTNIHGCMDSTVKAAYILVDSNRAAFTYNDPVCIFDTAFFHNTSTLHGSQNWNFGDGSVLVPSPDASHVYSASGTYTVSLTIFNGGCTNVTTHIIHINPGPPGGFTVSPTDPCPAPSVLTYTSTAPPGTIVSWQFTGAAGIDSGSTVAHTYEGGGEIHTSMYLQNPVTGCRDTVKNTDTILNLRFFSLPSLNQGCVPLTTVFNTIAVTIYPNGAAYTYPFAEGSFLWHFGDSSGVISTDSTPVHTYTAVGSYWDTVTAVTANGCPDTAYVQIKTGNPPDATFTAAPLHFCYKENAPVIFTATVVTGPVDVYTWSFGDETTEDTINTYHHVYSVSGVWSPTLTVSYHGCGDPTPAVDSNYITIDSPKAIISSSYDCAAFNHTTFINSSLGDDTHLWIFADGYTTTLDNPNHNNPAVSSYPVELTTYNINSGCRDTAIDLFNFGVDTSDFKADTTALCRYGTVRFTSSFSGGTASGYNWYINDTLLPDVAPVFSHVFNSPGIYTVRLIVTDAHGCPDTVTKPDFITVGGPAAHYAVSPATGCAPLAVTLRDSSTDVTGLTFKSFYWSFGDGHNETDTTAVISHIYSTAGKFPVIRYMVTDNFGCSDTATYIDTITTYRPHAAFFATQFRPCIDVPVTFTNASPGIVSSIWSFGDGATSIIPVHSYADTGTFNISLSVTDIHGCHDTATAPGYIVVTKPYAAFTQSDSFAVCPPLTVHFSNSSAGALTYAWSFGDGNTSTISSPGDLYSSGGVFNTRLIATNQWGCTDTAYGGVTIFGYAGSFSYATDHGCAPLPVHFTSSFTHVSSIIWDFGDGHTSPASVVDTITHTYTSAGAYVPKLILSDNSGCQNSSIGTDTIKTDSVTARFTTSPFPVCMQAPFNFIDQSTYHWSPVISRSWAYDSHSSSATSPLYTINAAGTYSVHLTAINGWGCAGSIDTSIIVYPLPVMTAGPDTVICVGDTATIQASGALSYTWIAAPTLSCTGCNPAKAFPSVNTVYTVSGTDVHGCRNTATVSVGTTSPLISGIFTVCAGRNDTLVNSGGSGTWSSSNVSVGTVGPVSGIVTAVSAGTAIVTYALGGNCRDTAVVTVRPLAEAGIIAGTSMICVNGVDTLSDTTTGGTWSISNANADINMTTASSIALTGFTAGMDTVSYIVTNSCSSDTATPYVVTIAPLPVISGIADICAGAVLPLHTTIGGGIWNSRDTIIAAIDTGGIVKAGTAITSISHTDVTYTTTAGCIDTATVTIYPIPNAGNITGRDSACKGAVFTLSDTAANGKWASSDVTKAAIDSTGIVTTMDTGNTTITYITGPNAAGCADTTLFLVKVIAADFSVSGIVNNANCYNSKDGSIAVAVSGGTGPFKYLWQTNDSTAAISSLDTGIYVVFIKELGTQCAGTDTFTVAQPDSLYISTETTKDICKTGTGSIAATVQGGTTPYKYQWSNNATGNELTGLAAGVYTLSLTDVKGCMKSFVTIVADSSCSGIVIHNGISPNGDGINDVWVIDGLMYYPHNKVQVFDKWGDLVFEKEHYENNWDCRGTSGALLPDGSYYYLVKLNAPAGTNEQDAYTGTLLIKR